MHAVVLPDLGGRLISLRYDAREFLWHDPALLDESFRPRVPVDPPPAGSPMTRWQNWGGDKSWPAPQALGPEDDGWHGPPDAVLDGGVYGVVDRTGEHEVHLRSAVDGRTGLQLTRAIELTSSGARVTTTITNRSARPRRFAPWEVMQVAVSEEDEVDGTMEIECAADVRAVELVHWWGRPNVVRRGNTISVGFGRAVGKLGFPGTVGRVECRFADGARLTLTFRPEGAAPDGAPFQLWLQTPLEQAPADSGGWRPAHRLVELEPVGALDDLQPGQSAALTAEWMLFPGAAAPGST